MKKKLLVLATTVLLTLNMVACSKPSTLEEYYTRPIIQEALEQEVEKSKETYASTYSDISYTVKENTFSYTYTLLQQIDDVESAAEALESSLDIQTLDTAITAIEKESGITGITVEYVYLNADGTEIYRKSHTKE